MEERTAIIENLVESASDYGKVSYQLAKLKTLEKSADVVSSTVPGMITISLLVTFLLFCSMGLAAWLNSILGSQSLGYFAVGVSYALAALVTHIFLRRRIKVWLSNLIIQHIIQ